MRAAGTGLATASLADDPEGVRRLLDQPWLEAVELHRPPLDGLPYREFVQAILTRQRFKLDFHGQAPDAVLKMVSDQLLGSGAFASERALLAEDISRLEAFAAGLVGGKGGPQVSIRTLFAPGDLVWHVDRVNERTAFRLLWPIGRPAGMLVTPSDNIDERLYGAYMRREHPLLCHLDTRVLRTGAEVERLWAHRPRQLAAMMSGSFPFLLDPDREWQIAPHAASIHRVETPARQGTYHRSSWANRHSPGLQVVITIASDEG